MRGRKSSYEEKELKGTLNKTRDNKKDIINSDPEISEYLNKIKTMLDMIWKKLNDPELYDVEELEKYSKLFIMWQKHYFTYKSLAPKKLKNNDIISELINNKES